MKQGTRKLLEQGGIMARWRYSGLCRDSLHHATMGTKDRAGERASDLAGGVLLDGRWGAWE